MNGFPEFCNALAETIRETTLAPTRENPEPRTVEDILETADIDRVARRVADRAAETFLTLASKALDR